VAIIGIAVAFFALLISLLPSSREKSDLPFNTESDDSAIQFFMSHQESIEDFRERIEKKTALVYYDLKRVRSYSRNGTASRG
jgi:hypothetical protein